MIFKKVHKLNNIVHLAYAHYTILIILLLPHHHQCIASVYSISICRGGPFYWVCCKRYRYAHDFIMFLALKAHVSNDILVWQSARPVSIDAVLNFVYTIIHLKHHGACKPMGLFFHTHPSAPDALIPNFSYMCRSHRLSTSKFSCHSLHTGNDTCVFWLIYRSCHWSVIC